MFARFGRKTAIVQLGVFLTLFSIILSVAFQDGVCRERPVIQINYSANTQEQSRRVYFYEPSGDESKLLELRAQLIEAGAYHVNTFTPSHIVCMLPERLSASSICGSAVAVEETHVQALRSGSTVPEVDFYRECYELAKELASTELKPFMEGREDALERQLISRPVIISPEEMAAQEAFAFDAGQSSAGTAAGRRFYQNTEFMLGNIVVNIILPESITYYNLETWTDERVAEALKGAIAALLVFQENYPHAAMNLIIRSYKQVPTYYECIAQSIDYPDSWMKNVISAIDTRYYNYWEPATTVVHKFNSAALNYFQADWVFTMFIVSAENSLYHMFRGARQIALSQRGGPYLACPFPAGDYYFHWDESYRLGAYLQREIGHVFWALDEDQFNKGDCFNRSGYLNFLNGSKIDDVIMGVPVNLCDIPDPCVMESPPWGAGYICKYTSGHLGIIDEDENGVPDIFDSSPIIRFEGGYAETLVADTFTVRGKAISVAIPNQNYKQDTTRWNDYACPLKDAVMNINGFGNLYLLPEDKHWDSIAEDLVIPLTDLSVGLTTVEIQIRNTAGLKSQPIVKNIFRAGLAYTLYSAEVGNEGINLSWYMIGETFKARFDLYRISSNDGTIDTTMIATDLQPSGEPENQFLPFKYYDSDVTPTRTYRYFVRGSYELAIQGGEPRMFITDSKIFKATAIIPIDEGSMMSTLFPNPFSTATNFSIRVPRNFQDSGINPVSPGGDGDRPRGLSREVPTEVKVTVYDVMGRYVTTVLDDKYYGSVLTLQWDGTTDMHELVPTGIYFLKTVVGGRTDVKKVTVLR
jgi:hypothetical protein